MHLAGVRFGPGDESHPIDLHSIGKVLPIENIVEKTTMRGSIYFVPMYKGPIIKFNKIKYP